MIKKLFTVLISAATPLQRFQLLAAFAVILCTIIINSAIPLLFKKSIEVLITHDSYKIVSYLIAYSLLWMIGQFMGTMRTYIVSLFLDGLSGQLTQKLFSHLHSLSLRFHLERQTGTLTHALTSIEHSLETLMWGSLLFLIPTIIELILALCIITTLYGFTYALILSSTFALFMVLSTITTTFTEQPQIEFISQRKATSSYLIESLSHAETVKYFSGQSFESKQCNSLVALQQKESRKFLTRSILLQNLQSLSIGIGLTVTLIITAQNMLTGVFGIGDFILIQNYILQFMMPLSHLGYLFFQSKKACIELADSLKFFEVEPEIRDVQNACEIHDKDIEIVFSSVSFGYEENRKILKDCSFSVSPGKKVALVGPSGAGKTTIVRLLFRLYDVTEGQITINNNNIKNIKQVSLHALIGYVPQEVLLFNNTLYYNITYGQSHRTKEDAMEAIQAAGLSSFIDALPEGLETVVGDRGLKISGGEKQRIALARAFLKKPAIYIFDEATSALDSTTEKIINTNIRAMSKKVTTLVIAHRLSSIVDADEILVLDAGHVVQRGTHNELLLSKSGLYTKLWAAQHAEPTYNYHLAGSGLEKSPSV